MKQNLGTFSVPNPVKQETDNDFLPPPEAQQVPKMDLAALQSMADREDILLPTALNVQCSKEKPDEDDILMAPTF